MARTDFIPTDDSSYLAWLTNFAAQCDAYQAALQLTPAELTEIAALKAEFDAAFNESNTAKAVAKAAVKRKDTVRQSTTAAIRRFARRFKGTEAVTPSMLSALQVVTSATNHPVSPVLELSVVGTSDGVNQLRWNRGSNEQGTIFVVEFRREGSSEWSLAGVVTSARFSHEEQTPGVETWYRVLTVRAGRTSAPTPAVAVYPSIGPGERLSIAA